MSIVRVGLSEHRKYAEGWEAIFGKKKNAKSANRSGSAPAKKTKKSASKKAKK